MATVVLTACFVINSAFHCFVHVMPDMDACIQARNSFNPGKDAGFVYCSVKR